MLKETNRSPAFNKPFGNEICETKVIQRFRYAKFVSVPKLCANRNVHFYMQKAIFGTRLY